MRILRHFYTRSTDELTAAWLWVVDQSSRTDQALRHLSLECQRMDNNATAFVDSTRSENQTVCGDALDEACESPNATHASQPFCVVAARALHATLARCDEATGEWHPPTALHHGFGPMAWRALGCVWVFVSALLALCFVHLLRKRSQRRQLAAHAKYL